MMGRFQPMTPAGGRWLTVIVWGLTTLVSVTAGAQAPDDSARKILKAMAEYVASQQTLTLAFETDIEVVTPDLQKIQFSSSGQVLLHRPNQFRASRTGGYADVELVFDGQTFTLYGKHHQIFAQLDAPGSSQQLIARLRDEYFVEFPGADLLSRAFDEWMEDVLDAKHIGLGVIDGVECEHLAFRNPDTDWQLWVEVGARPIPRKYVITSKTVTGAPQYTFRFKDWRTDVQPGAAAFAFQPPAEAKKIDFGALPHLDEVPPGLVIGGRK
jgi:hypothetical protein